MRPPRDDPRSFPAPREKEREREREKERGERESWRCWKIDAEEKPGPVLPIAEDARRNALLAGKRKTTATKKCLTRHV